MKSKQEIISWLKSSSQVRVILLEVAGVLVNGTPTNFYLSNRPFTTSPSDIPPNTQYQNVISGGIQFSETIDLGGGMPNIGFGDISINNVEGTRDNWLQYIWANKPATIYIGDVTWSRVDFFTIFKGLIRDIDSSDLNSINLLLVNGLQNINTPISNVLSENNPTSPNQLIPLTYGECFNVSPLLVDPVNLTYQVHTGKIQDIIEVRDNGAPVSITKNLNNGKFNLNNNPVGTITASVQGNQYSGTSYSSKIASVIRDILFPVIGQLPELVMKITTTSSNNLFSIELQGDRSPTVVVEWGDGSAATTTVNGSVSRVYTNTDTYTVKIRGIKFGFKITAGAQYVVDITQWGSAKLTNLNSAFKNCVFTSWTAQDTPDFSECVDMGSMFENAVNFNHSAVTSWQVAAVTNMSSMFKGCTNFNADISSWDTTNVTNMSSMFMNAAAFNKNISGWQVKNCVNFTSMFQGASQFNQDLSTWDVFHISTEPTNFDTGTTSWNTDLDPLNRPLWARTRSQPLLDLSTIKIDPVDQVYLEGEVPPLVLQSLPTSFYGNVQVPVAVDNTGKVKMYSAIQVPVAVSNTAKVIMYGNIQVPLEMYGARSYTFNFTASGSPPYNFTLPFDPAPPNNSVLLRVAGTFRTINTEYTQTGNDLSITAAIFTIGISTEVKVYAK